MPTFGQTKRKVITPDKQYGRKQQQQQRFSIH